MSPGLPFKAPCATQLIQGNIRLQPIGPPYKGFISSLSLTLTVPQPIISPSLYPKHPPSEDSQE